MNRSFLLRRAILYQLHYPEESNMKHAIEVGFNEALASASMIKAYHESGANWSNRHHTESNSKLSKRQ